MNTLRVLGPCVAVALAQTACDDTVLVIELGATSGQGGEGGWFSDGAGDPGGGYPDDSDGSRCRFDGVTAGREHTCARDRAGALWCWGSDAQGQLGDGAGDSSGPQLQRVGWPPTSALVGVTEVAAGLSHTCAVTANNISGTTYRTPWCWGSNDHGQLGNVIRGSASLPLPIYLADVRQIAAGHQHTCAVTEEGALYCWGAGGSGQLGDPSSPHADRSLPVRVEALGTQAVQVAAGRAHTCAVEQDGSLWCWGSNDHGQLGVEGTPGGADPIQVLTVGVLAVAAGADHTCVVREEGLTCWGSDEHGQLALDEGTDLSSSGGVLEVVAGEAHSCARAGAHAWCWGSNDWGQLGDSLPFAGLSAPLDAANAAGIAELAAGSAHTCARTRDGTLYCWGSNGAGQLGDGWAIDGGPQGVWLTAGCH